MVPMSIISIYGIRKILFGFDSTYFSKSIKKITTFNIGISKKFSDSRLIKKRQVGYAFVIIILVTTNAMSVYPSHVALNASYEVITTDNLDATRWIIENLDLNSTVVASDHRLARMSESAGFNTTLDETFKLWTAENFSDYISELEGIGKNHSRITHIIVDDIMRNRVVHVGFGKIVYFTNESYNKFSKEPFQLIYRNCTLNSNLEIEHWTEIYQVNWTYLNQLT
jgi:hypothetical protein